jgi:8-oxo-dGTP pyrophosphatase MutT (NUDIX family)
MNESPHPSAAAQRPLRPKDAATLIIVRRTDGKPRILMGKRHGGHAFMPNKYVFPGGRVDPADCRVPAAYDLHPQVLEKLMLRMRGQPSRARAHGLAMAAVRETFEEVGLIIGAPNTASMSSRSPAWQSFLATGYAPDLSGLRFFARAITPPGRPRRFDTRFFVLDASCVANADAPITAATEELLDPYWVTIEEAAALDLPSITKDILRRLGVALSEPERLAPGAPLPFQYSRGNSWRLETL